MGVVIYRCYNAEISPTHHLFDKWVNCLVSKTLGGEKLHLQFSRVCDNITEVLFFPFDNPKPHILICFCHVGLRKAANNHK